MTHSTNPTNYSLYGLPEVIEHCSQCLMTNQKPHSVNESESTAESGKKGMALDSSKVCDACNYSVQKEHHIDWERREKLLLQTLEKFRRDDGRYDCIVSGSGGKDSVMVAHLLKYKYNMNPLTVTYSPMLYTDVGWRNLQSWINVGGFDNILFSPNGQVLKHLTREAFLNLYHPMQPFKFGIKSYAAKMALKFDIDLVMYGESYQEYGSGDPDKAEVPTYDASLYVSDSEDLYIGGLSTEALMEKYGFTKNDLLPYMPLRSAELKDRLITIEHLGWYLKWDPQEAYYYAVDHCGFEPDTQRTDGTYGKYASIDDKMEWLHYFTHYIKFGIGRARFDASQEIRNAHITREEGLSLAYKFEGEFPTRYFKDIIDFMEITEEQFWRRTDEARSPHLWRKDEGKWVLWQELDELRGKVHGSGLPQQGHGAVE
jgi:N-acetyl sugar amidotransferase